MITNKLVHFERNPTSKPLMLFGDLVPAHEVVMSNCLSRYTRFYKAIEKLLFPESAIEAITDFRKV